ncbi:tRNA glutamyl-Q(34) synthetase GluQRS [Meridianimarinicoccus aquatilis]|uniref:tRNA glutamyl-Q(34) synthetase GluQRS n=1 Tax=Meridianimarinicoccus aquatilis TaxID=2552766 RepID=A0A4R6ARN8_9RHOB|nr:tRNA glutamyl-Q(34) synthetase GluQRS [Fluviibacterium aquatile]TDL84423.1 tRNA glutamyl-Q(34) synthetase GluQRS [Fluviibacterium aquatile]
MSIISRFAPSPTGPLHLGHAYSAMLAYDMSQAAGGQFLLRIEDIDRDRSRPEWEALIYDDLRWLGLSWPESVMRQSGRLGAYDEALDKLWEMGLLYPCSCTRRDIAQALSAPQEGVSFGPDGPIYPGTCRPSAPLTGPRPNEVLRLDMARAAAWIEQRTQLTSLHFSETGDQADQFCTDLPLSRLAARCGDIVLARRGMGTSYHLSVVVDDAAQSVTHVVRGSDLGPATILHVCLQKLLGLPTPTYHHHRLIRDETGKRLAKRDDARAIRLYRDEGASPAELRKWLSLPLAP